MTSVMNATSLRISAISLVVQYPDGVANTPLLNCFFLNSLAANLARTSPPARLSISHRELSLLPFSRTLLRTL